MENYFFEWLIWLGNAVYGLSFWEGGGWIALVPQALLLASILRVTGIPPTEVQALRSRVRPTGRTSGACPGSCRGRRGYDARPPGDPR
jgi:steroid 5-alpha reductase family enzyme